MNPHDPSLPAEPIEPTDDSLVAAEYVIGVLDATSRSLVQSRIESEPAFAALVMQWEYSFTAWLAAYPQAVPATHVWARLRIRMGWSAMDDAPVRPPATASGTAWQRIGFWRVTTALATAAAVVIAVLRLAPGPVASTVPAPASVAVTPQTAPESQLARPVTTLAHDDGTPGWLATVDKTDGKVLMVPVPTPPDPTGKVAELWLIPPGQAPKSLGLVSTEKAHTIAVPDALKPDLADGAVLAITLEPPGGAPHGVATGPVLAKGLIAMAR